MEETVSQPRVVFDPEQDDFFVLPGESLAKYTGGHAEGEPEEQSAGEDPSDIAYEKDRSLEGATQRMLAAAEAAEAAEAEEPPADEGAAAAREVTAVPEAVIVEAVAATVEVAPEPFVEEPADCGDCGRRAPARIGDRSGG